MNEPLNDDQIAALFEAAKHGETPDAAPRTPPSRHMPRTRPVDFTRPTKFTADHQRRIVRTMDAFCLGAAGRLTAELRNSVEFETLSTTQVTWAAAQTLLPVRSLAATILVKPLGTRLLLSVEAPFVLTVIEGMLGGTTDHPAKMRRFTEIDWTLSRRIIELIVHQLSAAWNDLASVSFEVEEIEEQTDATSITTVSEPTFVVLVEARMASQSATLGLLIPWNSIDPIADLIAGKEDTPAGARVFTELDRALAAAPVTLRAEVAALRLPVADVLSLKPGSVIRLGVAATDGVTLHIEHIRLARAQPGANGVKRAVQIQYHEPETGGDGW
ncbi:MAG: flagellar motor switch protein FliM [Solirubrobacteraceae bacterium]